MSTMFVWEASLAFVLVLAQTACSSDEHTIAIVRELYQGSELSRSLELFPDTLDVEVETDKGVEAFHLVKQKSMNVRSIPVAYDDPELNQRKFTLTKEVAYYQDLDKMTPIKVEATVDNGAVKRILTGTMIHSKRAYEIHPASSVLKSMADVLEQRGLGYDEQHSVHVLKEVDIRDYLRPHEIQLTPEQEQRRRELEKEVKEEKTLKTFLRLMSADDKDVDLKRSKRYASKSTTVFHVETMFVADYSVYMFWMESLKGDTAKVHEAILHFYTHIFNGIHMAFRRIDYDKHGIAIVFWLAKVHIITKSENEIAIPKYNGQASSEETFRQFSTFVSAEGYGWSYPDYSILWTKSDLATNLVDGQLTLDVLGVAYLCQVCHPGNAISLNEDGGFFAWVTGAHETGHMMGSDHDGEGDNTCSSSTVHIMYVSSYSLEGTMLLTAFVFSDCSVEQFKECFAGNNKYSFSWPLVCVYDTVCEHNEQLDHLDDLAGKRYNLTEQCQLFVDPTATFDEGCDDYNEQICENMFCLMPGGSCERSHSEYRASPGTPCDGSSPRSVCNGDDCVCYEGRCMDASDMKTVKTENDPSCSKVTYTPPEGCSDTYDECSQDVADSPWQCFTDFYKTNCKATCYKYGLFYLEDPPCTVNGDPTPEVSPSNVPPVDVSSGTPYFCQHNFIVGAMTCPNDPTVCIPMVWFCDGENDCSDGSDEMVEICQKVPCTQTAPDGELFYRCKADPTDCFLESEFMNGNNYCDDGSDEDQGWRDGAPRHCYGDGDSYNCPNNHAKCFSSSQLCDGVNDCEAKEGEEGEEFEEFCDNLKPMGDLLRCSNQGDDHSMITINTTQACDGDPQCPNGEDETIGWCLSNGIIPTCLEPDTILCPTSEKFRCIPKSWACDTEADCDGGGDEIVSWCEQNGVTPLCHEGEVMCSDKSQNFTCIAESSLCDGTEDCPGGVDEVPGNCNVMECQPEYVACPGAATGECIPQWWACDGVQDCQEGDDEDSNWCSSLPAATCTATQVQCKLYTFKCIPSYFVCDGDNDCGDNSDEESCSGKKKEFSHNDEETASKLLKASRKREYYNQQRVQELEAILKKKSG